MKPVEIQAMLYDHIEYVHDLDMVCCAESSYRRWTRQQISEIVTDNSYHKIVAIQNGRMIGYAVMQDMVGATSLLKRVGVVVTHRRRGIGTRLVRRLVVTAPLGNTIRVSPLDTETVFHHFLHRIGFEAKKVIRGNDRVRDIYVFEGRATMLATVSA